MKNNPTISIVIPIFNEEKNVAPLAEELAVLFRAAPHESFEVIFVNDGSRDGTLAELRKVAAGEARFKVVSFARNFGQTAAIAAGFAEARGEIVVPMDGDLENDPADILKLAAKLREGFDVVSGWRRGRWKNRPFSRRLPSFVANKIISLATGVKLHDYGCTLKAYRREILSGVKLYGEMHRFIPAYAAAHGAKVAEVPVNHRARRFGVSHYGMGRTTKVLLDLLLVKFLFNYGDRPIHFFGGLGIGSILFSALCFLLALYYKIAHLKDFVQTPLPIFTALFFIVGINFILMGVLAEFFMRASYEAGGKAVYEIGEKINF